MNYLDYIIIAVIVFYALWGLAKGFAKLIFDLMGYVVAIIAAKFFSPYLIDYFNSIGLSVNIKSSIIETINRISPTITGSLETIRFPGSINELLELEPGLRDVFSVFPNIRDTLDNNMASLSGEYFIETIAQYIIGILSILLIFIVVKIIFSVIVSVMLSRTETMPLAITNRILGLTLGLVVALMLITFSLQFIEVYSISLSPVMAETIADSKYAHIFTSIPLMEWLQSIIPK